jgi:2-polyprenyl-3-methyl-5-hydroxy-6-metoxy-1,4-benzoquinol methylase
MLACPLCRSKISRLVEVIPAPGLAELFRRSLGVDVAHLFTAAALELHRCEECDLRYFEYAEPGDQAFYAALNRNNWYYMDAKPEFQFAKSLIDTTDVVLEVGAGAGRFAKRISRDRYTGLEFSESARREAQAAGVGLLNESVEAHARANAGRYDVVCHFQVLEHVADPRSFLEACIACLKPHGKLLVAVPAYDSFLQFATNNLLNLPPHHLTHWSDAALRSIGRLFQLELMGLTHEPVAAFHRRGYLDTWLAFVLNRMLGRNPKLVDTGLRQRALSRAAAAAGARLESKIPDFFFGRGHTVSAVFHRG